MFLVYRFLRPSDLVSLSHTSAILVLVHVPTMWGNLGQGGGGGRRVKVVEEKSREGRREDSRT